MTERALEAERLREAYRARATKAEQEVAQWRERFDLLLKAAAMKEGAR